MQIKFLKIIFHTVGSTSSGTVNIIEKSDDHNYMIAVKYNENDTEHECIGVIVSEYKVVTPAHCVYNIDSIKLEFGILNSSKPEYTIDVSSQNVTLHPKYNSEMDHFDVAIIELTNKIKFGPKVTKIDMIELKEVRNQAILTDTEITILGYTKGDRKFYHMIQLSIIGAHVLLSICIEI